MVGFSSAHSRSLFSRRAFGTFSFENVGFAFENVYGIKLDDVIYFLCMAHRDSREHAREIANLPPSRDRDAIMLYLNGRSLRSIRDQLGYPNTDAVRDLIKPHRRFRCWQDRALPADKEAITQAMLEASLRDAESATEGPQK